MRRAAVAVRFLAEMNQVNNAYAAFDRDGAPRGRSHSTAAFRNAWRRATLILRRGPVAAIDARLGRLHLPPVHGAGAGAVLPRPQVAMAWVPQTRGTPDIPANLPAALRRLFVWVDAHRRVKLLLFNQGALEDGPFRLKRYPRARAELRRRLAGPRFR